VTFVERIAARPGRPDPTPPQIAAALPKPSAREMAEWQGHPDARRWALESFALSRRHVYRGLPVPLPGTRGEGDVYPLSPAYVAQATRITARQLSKAGFRLAAILNRAFAAAAPSP
jgi:nuclease S1